MRRLRQVSVGIVKRLFCFVLCLFYDKQVKKTGGTRGHHLRCIPWYVSVCASESFVIFCFEFGALQARWCTHVVCFCTLSQEGLLCGSREEGRANVGTAFQHVFTRGRFCAIHIQPAVILEIPVRLNAFLTYLRNTIMGMRCVLNDSSGVTKGSLSRIFISAFFASTASSTLP